MFDRIGVKIVCMVAALLLWVQVASTVNVEELVRLPVEVVGLPDSLAVRASALPDEVGVRLRGTRLQLLLSDIVARDLGQIQLDLTGRGAGRHSYELSVLDAVVNATALEIVPATTLVIDIQARITRSVPVRLTMAGEFPEGYALAAAPELTPPTIDVTGPQSLVENLAELRTEDLDLRRHRESFQMTLSLVAPNPDLEISPVEVEVAVGVDEIVERHFREVPVTVLSDLDASRIHLDPTHAQVQVRGAAALVHALAPEDVEVVLHIDATAAGVSEVGAQVLLPDGLLSSSLEPTTFQVVVDAPDATPTAEDGGGD
jgi:YbbR domain-containing protein